MEDTVELGFNLPQIGKGASPDSIKVVAQRCEELGYRTIWGLERILRPLNPQTRYASRPDGTFAPQYGNVYDGLEALTWAAAFTKRIRLGMSVLVLPWHPPIDTARRVATLDNLSGGRVDLGVGSGWSKDEYDAAGIPFERRAGRMKEYLQALRTLWGPDPVEHSGEFYRIPLGEAGPKPVQQPLPLYYATTHRLGYRMLAAYCEGWNPQRLTARQIQEISADLRAMLRENGRDPATLRIAYRVNMPVIAEPPVGDHMPFKGPLEQFPDDLAALAEAGVDEVHFETAFLPDVETTDDYLRWAEKLRVLWR